MPGDTTDATDMRLLGNILALLLDEQPGQAEAALAALRRKAVQGGITGGSLKNLFERATADFPDALAGARALRGETHWLQQELEAATVQASRYAAENAALHQSLAHAHLRLARYDAGEMAQRRELAGTTRGVPAPPAPPERLSRALSLLGGVLMALLATLLAHDQFGNFRAHPPAPTTHVGEPRSMPQARLTVPPVMDH